MTLEMNTSFLMMKMMMVFILTIFSATPVWSLSTVSYNDHCSSIVPESTPIEPDTTIFPNLQTVGSRYSGGEEILGRTASSSRFSFKASRKYVSFEPTKDIFKTNVRGVYKIKAFLVFEALDARPSIPLDSDHLTFHQYSNLTNLLRFQLDGFWSQYSGKLCMIGSASWSTKEGKHLDLHALLKLNYPINSTFSTSLVTGTLESLSPSVDLNYFEPISILVFTSSSNYKYTLVSDEFCKECADGIDFPQNKSFALQSGSFCSTVGARISTFWLEYSKECASLQNCTIFGHEVEHLPPAMYLNLIRCSEEERKVQYLAGFGNDTYSWYSRRFDPAATLIAEGSWDGDRNQLCIVACRILNSTDSTLGNAHVGDCSVRLSLRYPAFWSIRSRTHVAGQIWSNRTANELGYFRTIEFEGYRNSLRKEFPGLRYEYTKIERARKFCPANRAAAAAKKKGEMYPNPMQNSNDMRFSILVKDSKGRKASGYAYPVFVGDQICQPYNQYVLLTSHSNASEVGEKRSSSSSASLNISYAITLTELPVNTPHYLFSSPNYSYIIPVGRMEIYAEGIYDDQTGSLCMVGCRRRVGSDMDCELVLNLQFPPTNARTGGSIEGTMESLRKNSTDPLYLDPLRLSSVTFYSEAAKKSLRRMDLEIAMAFVSNTLACVFVALQIFHAKKNRDALPFVSVVMVAILALGYMIPLALNYEALFMRNHNHQRNVLARGGGWVEANEVIVRVVSMLAFLLQIRLLQLAVSARLDHQNHKALWKSEMKGFCASLPYHAVCFLIAFLVKVDKSNKVGNHLDPVKVAGTRTLLTPEGGGGIFERIPWEALRLYFGLLVDGFLLPQIVLNVLGISVVNKKALCVPFYVGTSLVRLVPHAYDIYRACNYARREYYGSYIYADPGADLYSTAWDVVISCGCVVFAVLVYFQQRFGGCCFLPRRLREEKSQPRTVHA